MNICPVCQKVLDEPPRREGDNIQFACAECGTFRVDVTALNVMRLERREVRERGLLAAKKRIGVPVITYIDLMGESPD